MTRQAIYGFIAAGKTTYPVRLLRRVLQVSTSAFYDWTHRGRPAISDSDLDDAHAANQLCDGRSAAVAWTSLARIHEAGLVRNAGTSVSSYVLAIAPSCPN